jgi:N-acetylglucosamine-6-phosphate deacetylase
VNAKRKIITGAKIYAPELIPSKSAVLIEEGRIAQIGSHAEAEAWPGGQRIDAGGLLLSPGFIELQINGGFGMDFTEQPDAIFPVAAHLPRFGVTRFLPTIITSPLEQIRLAQGAVRAGASKEFRGAVPVGLHLEGPFLNPERKGAHRAAYMRPPSVEDTGAWSPENGVRLVTLAPELEGAHEVIRALNQRGVVVSAGHSQASFQQARAGFQAGIRFATHLFNAMSPLTQHDPGLPGAVLAQPGLMFGLIVDGVHIHPTLVDFIWRLSGAERLVLVTDAMAALGMPPGEYQLGGQDVIVDGDSARLKTGILAGSILPHNTALRNLIAYTDCALAEALAGFTTNPAKLLGLENEIGRIAPGYRADMVLLTPDLEVAQTFVDGETVFQR